MVLINRDSKKSLAYPFVFYDRIIKMDEKSCLTLKNVTSNEWCIVRDARSEYCLPGIIIVECMAQTAGILEENRASIKPKQTFLIGMDKVKIFEQVLPGMQIMAKANLFEEKKFQTKYLVEASVENRCVARGEFQFASISRPNEE